MRTDFGLTAADRSIEDQRGINEVMGYDNNPLKSIWDTLTEPFTSKIKNTVSQVKAHPDIIKNALTAVENNEYLQGMFDKYWANRFSPFDDQGKRDNSKGLGAEWEKYNQMSNYGKARLMASHYLTNSEFEKDWNEKVKNSVNTETSWDAYLGGLEPMGSIPMSRTDLNYSVADKKLRQKQNQKILDNIYTEAAKEEADNSDTKDAIKEVYYNRPEITGRNDNETVSLFIKAITPDYKKGNIGVPEYASHFGIVEDGISEEMKDFSVDNMRQLLAKKAVYDAVLGPEKASAVLNDEAKEYIYDHRSGVKKAGIFANDVAISTVSYNMDKLNGFYRAGLNVADLAYDAPTVFIDDQNNILPLDDARVKRWKGQLGYIGQDNQFHSVHAEKVNRSTLHSMGKNTGILDTAGSDDTSIFNPIDWSKREQFGVWDKDLAKQYEQIGSSPYQPVFEPGTDRDILYESGKMMSFGLGDMAVQLIPFGIGATSKAIGSLGKAGSMLNTVGNKVAAMSDLLSTATKTGQAFQATAGAVGIAEAYTRTAFQEKLADNIAKLEEATSVKAYNDTMDRYANDKAYQQEVEARAKKLQDSYVGEVSIPLEDAVAAIIDQDSKDLLHQMKQSSEYADAQRQAATTAGVSANAIFWPEAIKYGLVNTFGHRRYLYSNPVNKAKANFKGLKNTTTSTGKRRLGLEDTKPTLGQKIGKIGKVTASQIWGGAWTNGTDDMMVDAASQVNDDSYNKYLNAYTSGEGMADLYRVTDGLWSYLHGFNGSFGDEDTWNAALVGGLGSVISGNINFTNLASLATKEGKQAYRDMYTQEYEMDADGKIVRDEAGKPKIKKIPWKDNWRDRLAFFIQNGVLSTYYGEKLGRKSMQEHADFVNNLLDEQDDFNILKELLSSDIGRENAVNLGDEKTMRFVQAFNAMRALDALGNSEKDPTTLSEVVQARKKLIERAAKLGTDEEHDFSEEELNSLIGQYYSVNQGEAQSEEANQNALRNIGINARKLQEAYKAYQEAEDKISALEEENGYTLNPLARGTIALKLALDGHWKERIQEMKADLGDNESDAAPPTGAALIASVGGKAAAKKIISVFEKQEGSLVDKVLLATNEMNNKLQAYDKAQENARNTSNSAEHLASLEQVNESRKEYEAAVEEKRFAEDYLEKARENKKALEEALKEVGTDKVKILSSEEILNLDPVTRAQVMDVYNRGVFSKAQIAQIEKAESALKLIPGALEKVQDLSTLTLRVRQNDDALNRIFRSPDAASLELERQQKQEAQHAYNVINHRNAETVADYVKQMVSAMKGKKGTKASEVDKAVYGILRLMNPSLLKHIDHYNLIPEHYDSLQQAKEWSGVLSDIDAVINNVEESQEWKDNISRALFSIVERANNREEIIANLEKVIDDVGDSQVANDFEKVLSGLEQLGYQRDATVVENRKARREREEKQRQLREAEKARQEEEEKQRKKAEEDAKIAAAEAQATAQKKAADIKAAQEQTTGDEQTGEGAFSIDFNTIEDRDASNDTPISAAIDLTEGESADEWVVPSNLKITRNIANDAFGESYTEGASDETVNESEQPKLKATADYLNGKMTNKEYLEALGYATGKNSWLESPNTTKEDIAERAQKSAEVRKQYLKNNKKQGTSVNSNVEELSEELDLNKPIVTKPSYHSSMKSQIGEKKSTWDYYTESEKETRDTKDGKLILSTAMRATLQPSIDYAVDAGVLDKSYKLSDATPSIENSAKVREATKALKDLGIDTPQQLIEFVEQNDGKNLEGNKKKSSAVNNSVKEQLIIDNGDSVQGKSATIDEQMSEASEGKEAYSSDENIDYAAQNGTGEHVIETSTTSLSGNAMSEWVGNKELENKKNAKYGNPVRYDKDLSSDGVLAHKKGNSQNSNDRMDKYYAWMNAAGIKLQNIIDQELGQILRQSPHAKVKFMVIRPENNATKDGDMKTHLMLVLDYDNKINKGITHIHNEKNGGVIESQGKQYLVIGTVGDMGNPSMRELRDILFSNNPKSTNGLGLVKRGTGEFWKNNPSERFYVHPTLETEVVPMSLIPGYIVKQLESDSNPEFRSVRELLADPARNPLGLEMNDLGFGIQELTKFLVVGASLDRVMVPRNVDRNSGSAFVLVPAGNGKMVPSYLKPLFYNEMNDGALKDKVIDLLNGLTAPDYAARLQAVENLSRIFHFDKDNNFILIGKPNTPKQNLVSLVRDGSPFKTFTLDSNFDRQAFMEAFSEMNPRVNITKSVLQSNVLLQQYDEAGALQTDIAQLATAGSSYSIYGLDAQGKMIQPETVNNDVPKTSKNSDFRNGDRTQVVFKHQYYNYDANEGRYYLNGIPMMDETLVRHLDYNRRVVEAGLSPIEKKGEWNTYILGNKEHPEGVRIHRNTKEVQEIPDVEAIQIIERVEKEKQDKERAEAAKKALEPNKTENVELGIEEQGLVVDNETGEMITPNELRQRQAERATQLEEKEKKEREEETPAEQPSRQSDKLHRSEAELENTDGQAATQNFSTLAKSKRWRKQVRDVIKRKWPKAPSNMVELEEFLRGKNVPIDAIGTSDADVQTWFNTIINCR